MENAFIEPPSLIARLLCLIYSSLFFVCQAVYCQLMVTQSTILQGQTGRGKKKTKLASSLKPSQKCDNPQSLLSTTKTVRQWQSRPVTGLSLCVTNTAWKLKEFYSKFSVLKLSYELLSNKNFLCPPPVMLWRSVWSILRVPRERCW